MSLSVYLQYFKDQHLEYIGHPYLVSYGKDQKILKELVGIYGAQKLVTLIHAFFKKVKTDEFLQKTGATIGIFKTQIPKLLMDLGNGEEKTRGKW